MNEKALRILEYNKIKELLEAEAASPLTKEWVRQLLPSEDPETVRQALAETAEAVSVIVHKGPVPIGSIYDVAGYANLADKGATLTMKQLLEVLYNLQAARSASAFLKSEDLPPIPLIGSLASVLVVEKNLESEIDRCILSEEEMADTASSELRNIRRSKVRQNEAIRAKLNSLVSSAGAAGLLQDSIVTMRQGRYVIPVKQEYKSRFPGIIHDQSSTGATLFIEPQAVVNLNNELRELELAEQKEIARILAELSAGVAAFHRQIINNQKILVSLDFFFAKAKLARRMKAEMPEISSDGKLFLKQARHPLIDKNKVVPVTIELGGAYDTLVITGPNTGGKTVTLKTAGLLSLMAQSGLHIPAADGSQVPVFKQIFADIGDEQSIEQSLSTFSSHMKNLVDILEGAGEGSLVLLDELGAGTDPSEGAALAISILNELYGRGAKTMATTHYTELKKYALSTYGVENASMEFNVETLSPTYRLVTGTPGKSNAFEISKKLGLPEHLIDYANTLLDRGEIAFEDVIASIEAERKAAEEDRDEALRLRLTMERDRAALAKELEKIQDRKESILEKAREEARDILDEAKDVLNEAQKELHELEKFNDPAERRKRQNQLRQQMKQQKERHAPAFKIPDNPQPVKAEELQVGDKVRILTLDQKGTVLTLPDSRKEIKVQVGQMQLTVKLSAVAKTDPNEGISGGHSTAKTRAAAWGSSKGEKKGYSATLMNKASSVTSSINVVGKNLDDALMDVEKYLDDAFIGGLKEVTLIHGRGAGILRNGIRQMLKQNKHVTGFRTGNYNEGGDGVTIVSLE